VTGREKQQTAIALSVEGGPSPLGAPCHPAGLGAWQLPPQAPWDL